MRRKDQPDKKGRGDRFPYVKPELIPLDVNAARGAAMTCGPGTGAMDCATGAAAAAPPPPPPPGKDPSGRR
jgi:hypothetical protein